MPERMFEMILWAFVRSSTAGESAGILRLREVEGAWATEGFVGSSSAHKTAGERKGNRFNCFEVNESDFPGTLLTLLQRMRLQV